MAIIEANNGAEMPSLNCNNLFLHHQPGIASDKSQSNEQGHRGGLIDVNSFERKFNEAADREPSSDHLAYIKRRGISDALRYLQKHRLIGFEAGAILFPMQHEGSIVGIQRVPTDGSKKIFIKGSSGSDGILRLPGSRPTIVTEAAIDAISAILSVDCSALVTFSASTINKLQGFDGDIVLFFDNDEAGSKATKKATAMLPTSRVVDWSLSPNGAKDINDLWCNGHQEIIEQMIEAAQPAKPSCSIVEEAKHIHAAKEDPLRQGKGGTTSYGAKAVEEELAVLNAAPEGSRNSQLNQSAFSLGQLIGGGELDRRQVESALTAIAIDIGLPSNEVSATIRSGIESGLKEPRKAPERKQEAKTDFDNQLESAINLNSIEYERNRKQIADELGVRLSWLDDQHARAKKEKTPESNADVVENTEPWPEPVDGDTLMVDIVNLLERHVVLPAGSADAMAHWIMLTYVYDNFRILPILGLTSPQKRCGKTTTLEIVTGLSHRALPASNISPAAVFRAIEKFKPTLIIDEADSFLKNNEELRGVLNSGHTRSAAFVVRCDGDSNDPTKFSTWAPKAIAAIGNLPGTISDRSVIVKLRRKSTEERRDKIGPIFDQQARIIRSKCQRWAVDNGDALCSNRCELLISENDRAVDNWTPLATIARTIGGEWPDRLEKAAQLMNDVPVDRDDLSMMLLEDIRDAFESIGRDRIFSSDLVNFLNELEERPWQDLNHGRGLTTNTLSRYLEPFDILSKRMRIENKNKRGYLCNFFTDSWNRYIHPKNDFQSGTVEQLKINEHLYEIQNGTQKSLFQPENQDNHLKINECSTVPLQKGCPGENICGSNDDEVVIP